MWVGGVGGWEYCICLPALRVLVGVLPCPAPSCRRKREEAEGEEAAPEEEGGRGSGRPKAASQQLQLRVLDCSNFDPSADQAIGANAFFRHYKDCSGASTHERGGEWGA